MQGQQAAQCRARLLRRQRLGQVRPRMVAVVELHQWQARTRRIGQQPVQSPAQRCAAVECVRAQAHQPARGHVGDAAVQAKAVELDGIGRRCRRLARQPRATRPRERRRLRQHGLELAGAERTRWQQRACTQALAQAGFLAGIHRVDQRLLQPRALKTATGDDQRLDIFALVDRLGQAQTQALLQEAPLGIGEEAPQRIERQVGRAGVLRRQRLQQPGRQGVSCFAQTLAGLAPARTVAEAARFIAAAERLRRERLQRVAHDQSRPRAGIDVVARGDVEQFADQHRRLAHAAVARVVAEVAEVEHVLRGGEQLQEQEAVVLPRRTVAGQAPSRMQFGGQLVEAGGGIAPGEVAVVHAQQADDPEWQQAHRHHAAHADAAGQQRCARVRLRQQVGEVRAHHLRRHRTAIAGGLRVASEAVDEGAQAVQRALRARCGRPFRQQRVEQVQQALAPARRRLCFAEHAPLAGEFAQQAHQRIERVQAAAFQLRPGRDTGDLVFAAARVAQQQTVQRELPGVGVVGRRIGGDAVRGIQAPTRACLAQPAMQAVDGVAVQPGGFGHGRAGQQVEHLVQPEARHRQVQQAQEHLGQRFARQRAGIGQRPGQRIVVAGAAEHRIQVGHVRIDVRCQHRDLARLQRRIEARVVQQGAQLVVQHLQLAQAGVTGVDLQAGIGQVERGARRRHGRRATVEQVRLQAPQQRVGALRGQRIGVDVDLGARVHHLVVPQQRHEVAAGGTPGLQQRVFLHVVGEQRAVATAAALAQRLQVSPIAARRRGQVEMQRAHARLGGQHAEHVGRDVEGGEHQQAFRQALRERAVVAAEAREVVVDAACTVVAPGGDRAPQSRLGVVLVGARFPAQQPVAAPGLVLLVHAGQFTGQRPGLQRVAVAQPGIHRCHRGRAAQRRIAQRAVQAPLQGGHVQVVGARTEIGVQRAGDELAGGEEFQVGGHTVPGRQRGLQPTPHRHLGDQHDIRRKRRLARHRIAQLLGQQRRKQLQCVGGIQAEVGRGVGGHRRRHCAGWRSQHRRPDGLGHSIPHGRARGRCPGATIIKLRGTVYVQPLAAKLRRCFSVNPLTPVHGPARRRRP